MSLRLIAASKTDVGKQREQNECSRLGESHGPFQDDYTRVYYRTRPYVYAAPLAPVGPKTRFLREYKPIPAPT